GRNGGFLGSKRYRIVRWKQRFLSLDLFWYARPATPLKEDYRTEENSFALIQQLPEFRRQTFVTAQCVDQYGGVQVNHSTRVRRPPVRRAARIAAFSAFASLRLPVGIRATMRSKTFNACARSSSLK